MKFLALTILVVALATQLTIFQVASQEPAGETSDTAENNGQNTPTNTTNTANTTNEVTPTNSSTSDTSNTSNNNGSTNNSGNGDAEAESGPVSSTTAATHVKLADLSEACEEKLKECFAKYTGSEYDLCDAYGNSSSCLGGSNCTDTERTRIETLLCCPDKMFADSVPDQCKVRVSQCVSTKMDASATSEDAFKSALCEIVEAEQCLGEEETGAKCDALQEKSVEDAAKCSARTLLSSALLLAAMLILNKLLP